MQSCVSPAPAASIRRLAIKWVPTVVRSRRSWFKCVLGVSRVPSADPWRIPNERSSSTRDMTECSWCPFARLPASPATWPSRIDNRQQAITSQWPLKSCQKRISPLNRLARPKVNSGVARAMFYCGISGGLETKPIKSDLAKRIGPPTTVPPGPNGWPIFQWSVGSTKGIVIEGLIIRRGRCILEVAGRPAKSNPRSIMVDWIVENWRFRGGAASRSTLKDCGDLNRRLEWTDYERIRWPRGLPTSGCHIGPCALARRCGISVSHRSDKACYL